MRAILTLFVIGAGATTLRAQEPPPPVPIPSPPGGAADAKPDREAAAFLAEKFPLKLKFDPLKAAGLAPSARPMVLTWDEAYRLALSRGEREKGNGPSGPLSAGEFGRLRAAVTAGPVREGFRDPTATLFDAIYRLQIVEFRTRRQAAWETILQLYHEYVKGGASSGITEADVDRVTLQTISAVAGTEEAIASYRDALDDLKRLLLLPVNAAVIIDGTSLAGFSRAYADLDAWARNIDNDPADLVAIIRRMPEWPDLILDGRSLRETTRAGLDDLEPVIDAATKGLTDEAVALQVRKGLRRYAVAGRNFDAQRTQLLFQAKERDRTLRRLIAPPTRDAAQTPNTNQGEATIALIRSMEDQLRSEERLIALWIEGQVARLALRRDLGLLPRDRGEWMRDLSSEPGAQVPPKAGR